MAFASTSQTSAARRRRRRRTAITLGVVALLLVGTFLAAGAYVEGWMGHRAQASAAPACIPAPGRPELTSAQVTVNVYNTTNRSGLAASAARDLRARGFTIATVSNDPLGQAVRGTAVVRYGVSGADAARLAAAQVAGATLVRDGRADDSVDVVLGAGFSALASPRGPQDTATTGPSTQVPPGPTTSGAASAVAPGVAAAC